jgi:RNA polymerase sigma-70 factor (ECF subfamily)
LEDAVRQYARLAYQVAYSALRNHHDAEDATQETFLRLLRYRGRLEKARNPRAFIARVAWRVALDQLRKRKRAAETPLEDTAIPVREMRARGRSPEAIAAANEMQTLLERLVSTLPRKLREPLALSTVEEMKTAEIAAVLGIPDASVRTRLFRARRLLQEKLTSLLEAAAGGMR